MLGRDDFMELSKKTLINTCLITAIAINLMLIALAIGGSKVPLYEKKGEPVSSSPDIPAKVRTEFIMELMESRPVSSSQSLSEDSEEVSNGRWVVDYYQEFEYQFDQYGKVIQKTPTQKEEYIRYWEKEGAR